MRQWNINPKKLCNKHLLGEHVEHHMMVGALNKGKNIQGFITKGLFEIHNINSRHTELANEMISRGFSHKSPLPKFKVFTAGKVNSKDNLINLRNRCKECAKLQDA